MTILLNSINIILGIILAFLVLVLFIIKISPRKRKIDNQREKQKFPIRNIAILGILFFIIAIISGATITGLLTSQDSDNDIENLFLRINKNNQIISSLESSIESLKNSESNESLVEVISDLEEQIKKLKEGNTKLKDEIEDLEKDIKYIYALFPITPY